MRVVQQLKLSGAAKICMHPRRVAPWCGLWVGGAVVGVAAAHKHDECMFLGVLSNEDCFS